jgi:hypothetical protein
MKNPSESEKHIKPRGKKLMQESQSNERFIYTQRMGELSVLAGK